MLFEKGQEVKTPLGYGIVAFQRMKAPEYREAEAVSVVLNDRVTIKGYQGTMFAAESVVVARK